jgi:hypothetical protein
MKLLGKRLTRPAATPKRTRGKCVDVKSTELKGGKRAPPGDRGACERQSKSQGSE